MECVLSIVDHGSIVEGLVTTLGGGVVGRARLEGPTNARFITAHAFRRRLERLIEDSSGRLDGAVCLAVNASLWAAPDTIREILADLVTIDRERIRLCPIERCALTGSLGTVDLKRGVVVRADVSSRGWGVGPDGQEAAVGGLGEILGDEASAFAIGLEGIRAALRAFERRSRNTAMKDLLLEHFAIASPQEILPPEHESPKLDRYAIAGFAPAVFEAARRDDAVAVEILDRAGRELATMVLALVNELELIDAGFSVLPMGSVFGLRGPLQETFIRTIKTKTAKANLVQEGLGAAAGGALLAIEHLGLKVRAGIAESLGSSLRAHG